LKTLLKTLAYRVSMPAARLITKSEYARHRGCQPGAVTAAISTGRITVVQKDGKELIDPDVADIQWARNTQTHKRNGRTGQAANHQTDLLPPAPDAEAPETRAEPASRYDVQEARAKRETHEANLAMMREQKEAGQLLERERVIKAAVDAGAQLRASLERLPTLSLELAAMTDPAQINLRLSQAVHDALHDAAEKLTLLATRQTADERSHDAA
jgi:hypothetical protein